MEVKAKYLRTILVDKWFDAELYSNLSHQKTVIKGGYYIIKSRASGNIITVLIRCPRCGVLGMLRRHEIKEVTKNTITIKPSLNYEKTCECKWHHYLRNGVFTNV